ncbi:helix-turn-helix transcriptional regulator [Ruegeria sp. HKCCD4332]|uniref:helix-turn-helix transcriptional regulator n=1 Tax=Ruegeria sp. HKCCD4332 TaxID=2683021 RepID=UPI0014913631|nr:helix-turn-helix transcriptional regulator [Ruegeria sp. HKCCD4332]NOD78806.1 LuxR family transcriptional regulator [Ruegeria sp. HKCCD4332]
MKRHTMTPITKERRATVLAGIIILQALCALFFIGDVIADLSGGGHLEDLHLGLETLAALALVGGVVFLMVELRRLLARVNDMDAGLRVARGQMAEVMEGFFEDWNLTQAERDIATMILKGLDNEAIAKVRNTAPGTVRAQATSIYSKSDTHGRAQFVSLFMEELMSGDFSTGEVAKGHQPLEANAPGDKLHAK